MRTTDGGEKLRIDIFDSSALMADLSLFRLAVTGVLWSHRTVRELPLNGKLGFRKL